MAVCSKGDSFLCVLMVCFVFAFCTLPFVFNITNTAVATGVAFTAPKVCNFTHSSSPKGAGVCVFAVFVYPFLLITNTILVSLPLAPLITLAIWYRSILGYHFFASIISVYVCASAIGGVPLLGVIAYAIGGGDSECNFSSYLNVMSYRCWLEGTAISLAISFCYVILSLPIAMIAIWSNDRSPINGFVEFIKEKIFLTKIKENGKVSPLS